jgi:Ran GTPase-activating protein (RanGAP) involved in mRNA processing and transport
MYFFIQKLTYLHLGWNLIGDEGAKHLADALRQNTVKYISSPYLCHYDLLFFIQTLTKLDIGGNQIGEKGANDLATALKDNMVGHILSIHLSHCYVHFFSHRNSWNSILAKIKSETKEQSISSRYTAFSTSFSH